MANTIKERTKIHQEKANFVPTSNTDCELYTGAINLKPTPVTAPGTQLSGGVSYFFVLLVHEAPSRKNQTVWNLVFSVSSYILVLR